LEIKWKKKVRREEKKEGDVDWIEWENENEQKEKNTPIEAYDHADKGAEKGEKGGICASIVFTIFSISFFLCRQCPGDERMSGCPLVTPRLCHLFSC
jgi:hypothetical protein